MPLKTEKRFAGEAANYVIVNGLLFKVTQHKESGKWTYYLPLVIPERLEANILNMYHNSLLAMHQGTNIEHSSRLENSSISQICS